MTGRNGVVVRARWPIVVALAVASPWACVDVTDIEVLEITGSGVLFGQAFLDVDGTGDFSPGDDPIPDAAVTLVASSSPEVVQVATTDSAGAFTLVDVALGSYRISLDSSVLGDSLEALGADVPITVEIGDTSLLNVGATFTQLTVEEVLGTPPGRRVFTSGIVLNTRPNFGDGQVHFAGDSLYLRALNVERGPLAPGDSVRLLGRVVSDQGRPALEDVTRFLLVPQAAQIVPVSVGTGAAAGADGGDLDAALVRIRDAEMTDTSTTAEGHFRFWADDGTDSVEVVIRDWLVPSFNTSAFRPDTIVRIVSLTGLLSPLQDGGGAVRWRVLPRGVLDVLLEQKNVSVSIATSLDTGAASLGDTVEVTVVIENAGPLTATNVEVRDTIPAGTKFLSASATAGSYADATGLWGVGDMVAGAADTLRIRLEVTTGTPGTVTNVAEILPLLLEFDLGGSDNVASASLTIS